MFICYRLNCSGSGVDRSHTSSTEAAAEYRVEFDEDLLIASIQNEAEVTQHMVDMMASTKTMRRRKEQYSDLTYRRRSRRAKQTLSTYIPKAPRESTWGDIFDEMMDRLRGRSRSQSGTRFTHPHIDDNFYDTDSSSHSTLYDVNQDGDIPDIEPYEQDSHFSQKDSKQCQIHPHLSPDHSKEIYTELSSHNHVQYRLSPPCTDSREDHTSSVTDSREDHTESGHIAAGVMSAADTSEQWVTRDEVYELSSFPADMLSDEGQPLNGYSCFSGPIGSQSSSSPSQISDSDDNKPGYLFDPKYTAMTSFTGSLEQSPGDTEDKSHPAEANNNEGGDVMYWEENWVAGDQRTGSSSPAVSLEEQCEGCIECQHHNHHSIKPTFCYKNQNCPTMLASCDSLQRGQTGCNGNGRVVELRLGNGGCVMDDRDPADTDIMLRSISFRRPDLASFILPMSPIRKTDSSEYTQ